VTADPTTRFAELVAHTGDALPLDEAALLVAAHARPDVDVVAEQARLDELAGGLARRTPDGLRDHLVDDLGFTGDPASYNEARSSLLPDVLDRRRGIPLSLAVVAIEVGRRCDVPLLGVGMPGHFLVRPADDPHRFYDLYGGGTTLDRTGARAIFDSLHGGAPWGEHLLDPVGSVAIVSRMLANLANAYRREGDRRALAWAVGLRLHLPGATERDRRELAVLLGAAGRYDAAADALEGTGQERDLEAAARLRARLN
jgi:regulator of sirC expression with transglutaminase-like and TPR domain